MFENETDLKKVYFASRSSLLSEKIRNQALKRYLYLRSLGYKLTPSQSTTNKSKTYLDYLMKSDYSERTKEDFKKLYLKLTK